MILPSFFFRKIGTILSFCVVAFSLLPAVSDAATCNITSTTTIDQTYIDGNSCETLNLMGGSTAPSVTWSGSINLVGSGSLVIGSGTTTFIGSLTLDASDSLTVTSTGRITHAAQSTAGLVISAQTVTVDTGGRIDAAAKGCIGGNVNSNGYGPSWATNECISGGRGSGRGGSGLLGGSGASHGGIGGNAATVLATTTVYGSAIAPTLLGAGGGGGYAGTGASGGAGGGYISITVNGTFTVNGVITANGAQGIYPGVWVGGGGGAGGSIAIAANVLTGTGSVTANGGDGAPTSGAGGGGGRLAIRYGSLGTFSLSSATATGGTKNGAVSSGSSGSGFALDRLVDDGVGAMTIMSGFDFPSDGDYVRDAITIQSGASLNCSAATTTALTISSSAWLNFSSVSWSCPSGYTAVSISSSAGISTTSTSITFSSATSVTILAPVWTNTTTTIANTQAGATANFSVSSSIAFTSFVYTGPSHAGYISTEGGLLSIPGSISVSLVSSTIYSSVSSTQLTSLSIDARSAISADGRGCSGGLSQFAGGYGPNWSSGICTYPGQGVGALGSSLSGGAGGTHGGAGGSYGVAVATSTTYGSSTLPTLFGAGGGGGYGAAPGGAGGGLINIVVSGSLSVDGGITAGGATGTHSGSWGGGGGGAGGSVNIRVGTLTGSGYIYAIGGGGVSPGAAAGGGGRIAVRYSSLGSFSLGNIVVSGGTKTGSGTNGSAGTTYTLVMNQTPNTPTSLGLASLVDGSTTSTVVPIFSFSLSDSDVGDTVKFRIQIDDTADFGSVVVDYTSALGAQGTLGFQVGQAAGSGSYSAGSNGQTLVDGSYYWRVKAIDASATESSYAAANNGSVAFIVDSATRTISFQLLTGSGSESLTATSVRLLLDIPHFENVTVNYAVSSTMTNAEGGGVDYTLNSGTATISAGETSTTIALTIVDDAIDETNETIGIEISSPTYASLGAASSMVYTITDNDTSGVSLTEAGGSTSVTEGGGTDTISLVLTSQPTSTVRLTFTTSTYGVTLDATYVEFTSGNWDTPQIVTVSATDDSVDELSPASALISTVASVPSGFAYGYDEVVVSDVTATVVDNDAAGITVTELGGSTSVTEGGATDTFTVVLTSQPTSTVRLTFTTSTYGVTLDATYVEFTSGNWESPQTVVVTATNDDIDEESPLSTMIASAVSIPSGFAYGYDQVLISDISAAVVDNDIAGVSLSKTTSAVVEGGATDSYTIALTSQPTSTIRVTFTTSTYGVTVGSSYLDFTQNNWNVPQTATITATNDLIAEGTATTAIAHAGTVPSGYAYGYSAGISISNMASVVTDNDTAGISVSTEDVAVSEGGSAQTMTFVLDTMPTSTVALTFSTSTNGITVSPMTLSFTSVNWSTPQTLTILATDDERYEANHATTVQFSVTTEVYGYPSVSLPTIAVAITDNDTSSITLSASTFTIREGANDTFTIVLASQPTSTVQLSFTVPNQLRISPSSVSFNESTWSVPQTVTITPVDDDRYAGSRNQSIQLGVITETSFISAEVPELVITITDNEQAAPGGGASAGAGVAIPIFIPWAPIPSTAGPSTNPTAFSIPSPTAEVNARVEADLRAFKVKAAEVERARFTAFIRFGGGPASRVLGEGERRAVLRDALETMRRSDIPQEDLERIASGQIPKTRNIDEERKQVARALPTFTSIFGRAPDFSSPMHNLAWNTLLYRIRFPRDLRLEQQGIKEFKQLFGRAPQDPFQWSVVRVLGYVQK